MKLERLNSDNRLKDVEAPQEIQSAENPEKPKIVSENPVSTQAESTKEVEEDDEEDINLARMHIKTEDREST